MEIRTQKIKEDLYYLGVNDRQTERFENMWPLPNGVAYNAYLFTGEKTCLMDTVKGLKEDVFMAQVQNILGDRQLDYLVIHHMEPDHSGCIRSVMEKYPKVMLVGNKKVRQMLYDFLGMETEQFIEVNENDELDLGDRKLKFFMTPMVHWPESQVSYEVNEKILFSQDIFGGYGTADGTIFDDEINYAERRTEYRRYYTNIVGKYSQMAKRALDKLGKLDIETICPVHGYIWRKNPGKIIADYTKWANYEVERGVMICYASMYGNTEQMAEELAVLLAQEGVQNIEIRDVCKTHPSYLISDVWEKKGLALVSCSYNNAALPMMKTLMHLLTIQKLENHVLGLVGTYGWSGGAMKELKEFADANKFDVCETKVETKGCMKAEDYELLKKLAKEMAEKI